MNIQKGLLFSLVAIATGSFYACSPSSPKLIAQPAPVYKKVDLKGNDMNFTPVVDILFLVDRSSSMGTYQANLSRNIDLFLNELSAMKVDYHIGVVPSDGNFYPNYGKLWGDTKYITPSTPNGINILKKNILVGTDGDTSEVFFDPLVEALSAKNIGTNGYNAGFIRSNAYFAVVYITDTEDQSDYQDSDSALDFLVKLKGGANKVLSYGIVIPSVLYPLPSGCSRDDGPPRKLESFLSKTVNKKNNEMNLCDSNFGTELAKFSKDLVKYLTGTIQLTRAPIVSTIKVTYGGVEIPPGVDSGWYYDPKQNAVIIGDNVVMDEAGDGSGLKVSFDSTLFPEETNP